MKTKIQNSFMIGLLIMSAFQMSFAQPNWSRVNYPTSSVFTGIVSVNGANATSTDMVGVFVDGECRMIASVFHVNDTSFVSAVIHVDSLGENATIKFWDSQSNSIYELDTLFSVQSHGSIKRFPIEIKSTEIPQEPTSVQTLSTQDNVRVFPSPFINAIHVSADKIIANVTVYNTIGNMLYVGENINQTTTIIETSHFANGFYLVQVEFVDGSIVTKKLVKQN